MWRELGYGDWQDETAARALYQLLLTRLEPERVGWSAAGFNSVPVPPLPGKPLQLPLSAEGGKLKFCPQIYGRKDQWNH